MKRHPGNTDPAETPAYLPDWPQRWPTSQAEARRAVEDTHPNGSADRTRRHIFYTVVTIAAVAALVALPLLISVPLIISVAASTVAAKERTTRRRSRRRAS